jgi:alpha-glucoside transport system substrate-binding protein
MPKYLLLIRISIICFLTAFTGCQPEQQKVTVLGVWGGSELDVFNQIISAFQDKTGIKVEFEATRDINTILVSRIQAGNPPDIAILPQLSLLVDMAKENHLKELSPLLDMNELEKSYSQSWIDLGSVNGKFYGLFFKTAIKGLVYYDPEEFQKAGLTVPKTWDEMMALSQKLVAEGKTPWAIGIESGDATGWPATDWIENIFVRLYGAQKYRDWYDGKLAWTSSEVKKAWQLFGDIACNDKMVYGGRNGVISTSFQTAGNPVFSSPPQAYMLQQASFMAGMIRQAFPDLKPITQLNFFILPPINPQYSAVEIGGDVLAAFKDTPQVRSFLTYLSTADAQAYFAKTGATMPNKNVPQSAYETDIDKSFAKILASANTVVFDASDMMPSELNSQFWSATVSYVQDPSKLDELLGKLETLRQTAYK